ncbi:MAG: nicotinate (nicotinamide) nucleotide adenylyltransferase [Candidatus Dormibacteraeota bacterium]|nr:nicotinate (nicotinamide) nucleotide adenylyltransferase [Candidatus Dormibacteraeota bacterium]
MHRGHLSAATQLLARAGLDEVWLMPNAQPPHRTSLPLAPAQDRLQMVRLATANVRGLSVCPLEVERGGISYTIDTFRRLRLSEPDRPLQLLLGSDAALQIESWHEAQELLREASFVIFSRPPVALASGQLERLGFPADRTQVVTLQTPAISGRMVRERLRRGEPVLDLVTPEVADYIRDRGLYRS